MAATTSGSSAGTEQAGAAGALAAGGTEGTERGASSVEVYGFVGWIASAVAFALWLAWAYLPEPALRALGVAYYPGKHWALTLPAWLLLLAAAVFWAYEGYSMSGAHPLASLAALHDERSKWADVLGMSSVAQGTERSIPPLVHVPAPLVSRVLYGGQPVAGCRSASTSPPGQLLTALVQHM